MRDNKKNLIEILFDGIVGLFHLTRFSQPTHNSIEKEPPSPIKAEGVKSEYKETNITGPAQEPNLVIKKKFLICPIQGLDESGEPLDSRTVKISAVLDHSGTAIDSNSQLRWGKKAKDQRVKSFNGDVGEGQQCPQEPCGYPKKDSSKFFENGEINYVGVSSDGGKYTLQYDGHAGYDFPYQPNTPVIAPADGHLYKASEGKDLIYGANWDKDHSFYIEHENGFVTWYRHCQKIEDRIESEISNNLSKGVSVVRGEIIAFTGRFEAWKADGTSAHLHFEVRNEEGNIVDPYGEQLWEDLI